MIQIGDQVEVQGGIYSLCPTLRDCLIVGVIDYGGEPETHRAYKLKYDGSDDILVLNSSYIKKVKRVIRDV